MSKFYDRTKKELKEHDGRIKVALAGVTVAAAMAAEATTFPFHGAINVTPEVLKALDEGRPLWKLFKPDGGPIPNPLWLMDLQNPEDKDRLITFQSFDPGVASPSTASYLKHRSMKKWGSSAVSIGGIFSSSHTLGINIFGIGKEGNSIGVTLTHIGEFRNIGANEAYRGNLSLKEWVDQIVLLKEYKLNIRSTNFLGAIIPHASVVTTLATEFQKLGLHFYYKSICDTLAVDIHYAAFLEMVYRNGQGPATDIVRELFARRGALAVLGRYDPNDYIREPGGWMAIADKIAMI